MNKLRKLFEFVTIVLIVISAFTTLLATSAYAVYDFKPGWPFTTVGYEHYIRVVDNYSPSYSLKEHKGMDIAADIGDEVLAVESGVVVEVVNTKPDSYEENSWGNYVRIKHSVNGTDYYSLYAHLKKGSVRVSNGATITRGTVIGEVGVSGASTGPHLHLEMNTGTRWTKSFDYYKENLSSISGVWFNSNSKNYSKQYSSWITENCQPVSYNGATYYEFDPNGTYVYVQQFLDRCTSSPCNYILTVKNDGYVVTIPVYNIQTENIEFMKAGDSYTSTVKWTNPYNETWYEVTCKNGQRGFISGSSVTLSQPPSNLFASGYEGNPGTPSGNLSPGNNFGLRGIISSNYTITQVIAHIYDSSGKDAAGTTAYQTSWNSTSYNIQTDGINNHFAFRNLGNGTYRYVVLAQDASMSSPKELINSSFQIGSSSTSEYQNTWTNTGNMAVDIAEVAYTQVGYQETGTNHTKYNQWYYGNDTAAAWCATFVSWCADQAGIPQSIIHRTTYAYPGDEDFNVPYYSFGSVQPERGDLVFVENNGNLNYGNVYGFDHVGIVYGVDGSYIYTVEGNDGNKVTYNRYSTSNGYDIDKENAYIAWIGKPNYSGYQPVIVPTGTIPEKLASILSEYPDGSSWTATFDGSKKSYGFAGLVVYKLFGNSTVSGKTYRWWTYAGVSTSGMQAIGSIGTCSEGNVRDLLLQARPGDVLQYDQGGASGTQFSMIVYSLTNSGANIYDCNFNGDSIVRLHHMSYAELAQLQSAGPKGKLTLLRSDNYDSIDPPVQKSIFDLNGYLDNKLTWGNIDGFGTVDVYINGVLAASAVSDYCEELPVGTAYEIRNIQALAGHVYSGVYSGSLSGTIGTERVEVLLSFNTLVHLNLDGFLDGKSNDGLAQYGVADVYINGNKVAESCVDYWEAWIPGTTYEIKNIRANDGYRYDGVRSGSLSGTIGTERVDVVLQFSTLQNFTLSFNANGGTGAPAVQTKTQGANLTLTTATPTRAATSAGSYTVTLNANGGSVSPASLSAARSTSYTFKNWNTSANGSGISYAPGATYSTDANVTLYAQWNSSTKTAAVTLPSPARSGYIFKGWATSKTASSGVIGSYTPTHDVTLYAIWGGPDFIPPSSLTVIEAEAFSGSAFTSVKLPEGVTTIGSRAFADCPKLRYIYIPEATTGIAGNAFDGVSNLTILGQSGSYAEFYAQRYGYSFTAVE